MVEAVKTAGTFRFLVECHDFRHSHLHAECQFVGLDPSGKGGVLRIFKCRKAIESTHQSELRLLFLSEDVRPRPCVGQRLFGVDFELHSLVFGSEVVRAMGSNTSAAVRDRAAHYDKLREVLIECPEAVVDPGTDGGELTL